MATKERYGSASSDELARVYRAIDLRYSGRFTTSLYKDSSTTPDGKTWRIYRATLHTVAGPIVWAFVDAKTGKIEVYGSDPDERERFGREHGYPEERPEEFRARRHEGGKNPRVSAPLKKRIDRVLRGR